MDTSVWWSGDLFSAMRTTLGADRAREHLEAHVAGDTVTSAHLRAEHVVDWATRGGAEVLQRDDLGSLEPGKKADVVLIKNDHSPVSFPLLNPYGHVAFQAQRGDVHTVIIDGQVVKDEHRLVGVDLEKARTAVAATVDHLRSEMGEDVWQAGMNPDLPADDKVLDNPYTYTDYRTAATREARESIFGEAASSSSEAVGHGRTRERSRLRRGPRGRAGRAVLPLRRRPPHHDAERGCRGCRPGPADRPPAAAHPGRARLRPESTARLRPDPEGAEPGDGLRIVTLGLWDLARPHLEALVARTGESSSMAQLDGSDIVYVARVAVPKIIALRVEIGTRFPAADVAGQGAARRLVRGRGRRRTDRAEPLGSTGGNRAEPAAEFRRELIRVRAQGWALADEELAPGVRSVAAPVRDHQGGSAPP